MAEEKGLPAGVDDPYKLLEVSQEASTKDIRRAYRRRARDIHPDKNPDDPEAKRNFHELQEVYEFLIDVKKRYAFDESRRKTEERQARFQQQSSVKRKYAVDLEKREAEAAKSSIGKRTAEVYSTVDRTRDLTTAWIQEQQRDAFTSKDSRCETHSKDSGFIEVSWGIDASPLSITKSSLDFSFQPFGRLEFLSYDIQSRRAIVALPRPKALEAALHFLQNRSSYIFHTKMLKVLPSGFLNAAEKTNLNNSSDHETSQSTNVKQKDVQDNAEVDLPKYEASILDRLRNAAKQQKSNREDKISF